MKYDILSTLVAVVYFNPKLRTAYGTPEGIFFLLSFITILTDKLVLWLFEQ